MVIVASATTLGITIVSSAEGVTVVSPLGVSVTVGWALSIVITPPLIIAPTTDETEPAVHGGAAVTRQFVAPATTEIQSPALSATEVRPCNAPPSSVPAAMTSEDPATLDRNVIVRPIIVDAAGRVNVSGAVASKSVPPSVGTTV
jgi:hypothetical protein